MPGRLKKVDPQNSVRRNGRFLSAIKSKVCLNPWFDMVLSLKPLYAFMQWNTISPPKIDWKAYTRLPAQTVFRTNEIIYCFCLPNINFWKLTGNWNTVAILIYLNTFRQFHKFFSFITSPNLTNNGLHWIAYLLSVGAQ